MSAGGYIQLGCYGTGYSVNLDDQGQSRYAD